MNTLVKMIMAILIKFLLIKSTCQLNGHFIEIVLIKQINYKILRNFIMFISEMNLSKSV